METKTKSVEGVVEIAARIGCAISTLYQWWENDAALRSIVSRQKIGRRTYWTARAVDLDRYAEKRGSA